LIGLLLIRSADLVRPPTVVRAPGQLRSALRYVAARPHVGWTILLVGVIGTFGLNFPVVLTAMADSTFHGGANLYGLFNVVLALGSVAGALIAGGRTRTRLRTLVVMAMVFGLAQVAAALAPGLGTFLGALVALGMVNLALQAMANSSVQSWVDPAVRGRVMGLYMLAFAGDRLDHVDVRTAGGHGRLRPRTDDRRGRGRGGAAAESGQCAPDRAAATGRGGGECTPDPPAATGRGGGVAAAVGVCL
jgi:hypothetical protein